MHIEKSSVSDTLHNMPSNISLLHNMPSNISLRNLFMHFLLRFTFCFCLFLCLFLWLFLEEKIGGGEKYVFQTSFFLEFFFGLFNLVTQLMSINHGRTRRTLDYYLSLSLDTRELFLV